MKLLDGATAILQEHPEPALVEDGKTGPGSNVVHQATLGSPYDVMANRIQNIVVLGNQVALGVVVDQWVLEGGTGSVISSAHPCRGGKRHFAPVS